MRTRPAWRAVLLAGALACLPAGCRTAPKEAVFDGLHRSAMGGAPAEPLMDDELPSERAALVRRVEQDLDHEYRVTLESVVLTRPGAAVDRAEAAARARRYMEGELGAERLVPATATATDAARLTLWRLDRPALRYIALAMEATPAPLGPERAPTGVADPSAWPARDRIGYFELTPVACASPGCRMPPPHRRVAARLQAWTRLDPPSRALAARELPQETAEMAGWLERRLSGAYRVTGARYVLTEPGFTEWASLGSRAGQFMERELGAVPERREPDAGLEGAVADPDACLFMLWKLEDATPRRIALAMTREPPPGTGGRRLVGYFELTPME